MKNLPNLAKLFYFVIGRFSMGAGLRHPPGRRCRGAAPYVPVKTGPKILFLDGNAPRDGDGIGEAPAV